MSGPLDVASSAQSPTTPFTYKNPSKFGRFLELGTLGAYDPTGGFDTGKVSGAKPTKFGALLNVVRPAVQGGLVGAFMGKSTPGGGFAAETNFRLQQAMRQMQYMNFIQNLAKTQSEIGKNTAETQWNLRRPLLTRTPTPVKVVNPDGSVGYMSQSPMTGEMEQIPGAVAPGAPPDIGITPTDQGDVAYDRHATIKAGQPLNAVPLRLAQAADAEKNIKGGTAESAEEPSAVAQGTASQSPDGIRTSVPLMPPNTTAAKPTIIRNRNAAGTETDSIIDENPRSPTFGKTLKGDVASRAKLPNAGEESRGAKETQTADAETIANKLIDKTSKYNPTSKKTEPDYDGALAALNQLKITDPAHAKYYESLAPQIRKAIRDRAKPARSGRQRLTPEQAASMGLTPTNQSSVGGEEEDEDEEEQP